MSEHCASISAATQNKMPTRRKGAGSSDASGFRNHSSKLGLLSLSSWSYAAFRRLSHSLYCSDSATPRKESATREKAIPFSSSWAASFTISVRFRTTFSLESLPLHTAMVRMCSAFWHRSTPPCPFGRKMIITSVCEQFLVIRRASNVSLTWKKSCQLRESSGSKPTVRASIPPPANFEERMVCISLSASISTARSRLMRYPSGVAESCKSSTASSMSSRFALATFAAVGSVLPTVDPLSSEPSIQYCLIVPDEPPILTAASSTCNGSCLVRRASSLISTNILFRIFFSDLIVMERTFASLINTFNNGCGRSQRKADTAASLRFCSAEMTVLCFFSSELPFDFGGLPRLDFFRDFFRHSEDVSLILGSAATSAPAPEAAALPPSLPSALSRFRFSPATFASESGAPLHSVIWLRIMS